MLAATTSGAHQRALTMSSATGHVLHGNGIGGEQHDHPQQKSAEQHHDCWVSEARAQARSEMQPQRPQDAGPYDTDEEQESPEAEPYLPDRPQRRNEDDEDHELNDERLNIERRKPADRPF